jgi:uncharacterized membrane protein YjgN (DUF898 family)
MAAPSREFLLMNDLSGFSTVPAVAPPPHQRLEFTGNRGDFVRLVLRGAVLELLTFGFYRFWLATDMRRHLWSNTTVAGDAPEYTGTPKELLFGFLFAVAILLPVYVGYFLLGIEAERLQDYASAPLALFFYLFAQFALYRARRYRVTRTIWRGVRFGMGGSGLVYMLRWTLWTLASMLTLGILFPWRQAALERYKMSHTSYGPLQGRFDGTGAGLFKSVWWIWLLGLGGMSLFVIIPAVSLQAAPVLFVMPVALVFVYAAYKATEWRWWLNGIRLGEVSVESDLTRGELMGIYWKVIGWCVLLLIGVAAWFFGATAVYAAMIGISGGWEEKAALGVQHIPVLVAIVLGYLLAALAAGAVLRIYLTRDLWVRLAQSATVHNLAALDAVAGQAGMAGAIGEGFADSMDIGGF